MSLSPPQAFERTEPAAHAAPSSLVVTVSLFAVISEYLVAACAPDAIALATQAPTSIFFIVSSIFASCACVACGCDAPRRRRRASVDIAPVDRRFVSFHERHRVQRLRAPYNTRVSRKGETVLVKGQKGTKRHRRVKRRQRSPTVASYTNTRTPMYGPTRAGSVGRSAESTRCGAVDRSSLPDADALDARG